MNSFLFLSLLPGLNNNSLIRLEREAGGIKNILSLSDNIIKDILTVSARKKITPFISKDIILQKAEQIETSCKKKNINILTLDSKEYPLHLKHIYQPPFVLYMIGELPDSFYSFEKRNIAIVGTRHPHPYVKDFVRRLATELADNTYYVISGMAMGLDTEAHYGSYKQGRTLCVLGSGIDRPYPLRNYNLYQKVVANGGAVISEYAPGTEPKPYYFPLRNRIISGLSDVLFMAQAASRSGALITVKYALDQNKEIATLNYNLDQDEFAGNKKIIDEGAYPVKKISDFFDYLRKNAYFTYNDKKSSDVFLNNEENKILNFLTFEPKTMTDIYEQVSLPLQLISSSIMKLSMKGFIKCLPGERYYKI